jgi:hypothetical protein
MAKAVRGMVTAMKRARAIAAGAIATATRRVRARVVRG